mmetsp:Transcript_29543/g.60514  ORF Transcript_29543/g.60514 Transcript_29543/m.60514 type:complete len:200 (+) Transcript_29543:654-1253(+)
MFMKQQIEMLTAVLTTIIPGVDPVLHVPKSPSGLDLPSEASMLESFMPPIMYRMPTTTKTRIQRTDTIERWSVSANTANSMDRMTEDVIIPPRTFFCMAARWALVLFMPAEATSIHMVHTRRHAGTVNIARTPNRGPIQRRSNDSSLSINSDEVTYAQVIMADNSEAAVDRKRVVVAMFIFNFFCTSCPMTGIIVFMWM